MKRKSLLVIAAMLAGLTCGGIVHAQDEAEKQAQDAAEKWLATIDAGDYATGWEQAAELMKSVVTKKQLNQQLGAVRSPLGDVVSRKLKSAQFMRRLPGAPDGQYVVLQYETSFTNKSLAIETVTPAKEEDGIWRVSGYYIK
jgi:hypothetical protein